MKKLILSVFLCWCGQGKYRERTKNNHIAGIREPGSAGMAMDAAGDLYVSYYDNQQQVSNLGTKILEVPAGGGPPISLATFLDQPWYLALDGGGDIFAITNPQIYEVPRVQVPTYTFASAPVGAASADSPQAFPVQNTGNADLSLSQLALDPLDNFVQATAPEAPPDSATGFVLSPGAMCDLNIGFTPKSAGLLKATGALVSNSGNTTSTQKIPVAGIGGATGASISFPVGFITLDNVPTGFTVNGSAASATTPCCLLTEELSKPEAPFSTRRSGQGTSRHHSISS